MDCRDCGKDDAKRYAGCGTVRHCGKEGKLEGASEVLSTRAGEEDVPGDREENRDFEQI